MFEAPHQAPVASSETPNLTVSIYHHPRAKKHQEMLKAKEINCILSLETGQTNQSTEPFHPFRSLRDYLFADVAVRARLTSAQIHQLLRTYSGEQPLSFANATAVYAAVDQAAAAALSLVCSLHKLSS